MGRLEVGDVRLEPRQTVSFDERGRDVPRVVFWRAVDRRNLDLVLVARGAQMDTILQRHAVKHFGVSNLLDSGPVRRRDALVVLDCGHTALSVVLPLGCESQHALELESVGRRLLLGGLTVLHDGRRFLPQFRSKSRKRRFSLALESVPDGAQHAEGDRLDIPTHAARW